MFQFLSASGRRRAGALQPLWPHRQQWHQLPGVLRGGFRLLKSVRPLSPGGAARAPWLGGATGLLLATAALAGLLAGRLTARAEGFGRWASPTRQCDLQINRREQNCQALRLDQNLAGLLTVRFLVEADGSRTMAEELLFVGQLQAGQPAMRCSVDGQCEPQWPTRLLVSTVADSRYDDRGLIMGLPQTHLVQGSCVLERDRVLCDASSREGGSWIAEAAP